MKEVNFPIWFNGVIMFAATWFTHTLLTLPQDMYLLGMGCSALICASGLKGEHAIDIFFRSVDMEQIRVISQEKKDYGYIAFINLPTGFSLTQIELYKEALEQHLNAKIKLEYEDNKIKVTVYTKKLEKSYPFQLHKTEHPLQLVMGHTIEGIYVEDLRQSHHILLAGMTGYGKSTLERGILTQLISQWNRDKLQINLVDFKIVELSIFKRSKVVNSFCTTPEELMDLLNSLEEESKRRYTMFEEKGIVDITGWNKKYYPKLPYILTFIDEFAQLEDEKTVMKALKKRLAQDRGAGLNYCICTQRPSHELLPGSLKANLNTKVAFRASTAKNSEVILDETGAEKLTVPGRGLVKFIDTQEFQAMYLSEDQARELIRGK